MRQEVYTSVDYERSIMDKRSTTKYCAFLKGNSSWGSKKQNVVAQSNSKAEFRAIACSICELLCMKIILRDLIIKWNSPMRLYCDYKSAFVLHIIPYNTTELNMLKLIDTS